MGVKKEDKYINIKSKLKLLGNKKKLEFQRLLDKLHNDLKTSLTNHFS
jgi:hypothetical protein